MSYRRGFFVTTALITALTLVPSDRVATSQENAKPDDQILALMDEVNAQLEAEGAEMRVASAHYITGGKSGKSGNTVHARGIGANRLGVDFVPFDPRRAAWSGPVNGTVDDITVAIDRTADAAPPLGGLTAAQTTEAIRRAMATWDGAKCSNLALREVATNADLGFFASINRLGGSRVIVADIMHAGFRDLARHVDLAGDVLAVTYIFVFFDSTGAPTDIDNNGKLDTRFAEIYYDPSVQWRVGADVDVETIALHEAGHALGLAHFGQTFTRKDGSLDTTPMAVMNPVYAGPRHKLHGPDMGLHCSHWASWGKK